MKFLWIAALFTVAASAAEMPLPQCEAWYAPSVAHQAERKGMMVESSSELEVTFQTTFKGYNYTMTWDKELASYNMTIASGARELVYAMARIPTKANPQSFTQVTLPDGAVLTLECEIQEYRF